jgi:hypothetical protein
MGDKTMKILKYNLCTRVNHGTEENPQIEEILYPVEMGWNEINEEIAKKEAYNGEYTIEDDGQPEPEAPATLENRVETLETDSTEMREALDMILSGVTE